MDSRAPLDDRASARSFDPAQDSSRSGLISRLASGVPGLVKIVRCLVATRVRSVL